MSTTPAACIGTAIVCLWPQQGTRSTEVGAFVGPSRGDRELALCDLTSRGCSSCLLLRYCTDWGPCIGAPAQSPEACDGTDGCWWEQWGATISDGACSEGERPPSTTQAPTDSPSPPPPPTFFTCGDAEFKCESIDRCIDIGWTCDGISE